MKLRSSAGVVAVLAVVAAALVLTGCGTSKQGQGGSTSPTASVDAANTLKQAADAMRKVTGMHLNVTVQGNVPNFALTKLDGDVSNTPQTVATGTATLIVGKKGVDSKFVFVDGHLYSDLADSGKYTDYGDGKSIYDVSTVLDPNRGLANLLANLKDAKAAGSEQVNGIPTTKITGTSSSNDIATLSGTRLSPDNVTTTPTTVWIASDGSYHLVRLQIAPAENATVTLTMSEWGKQVTATKPV
jgi:lipoprotein LprA